MNRRIGGTGVALIAAACTVGAVSAATPPPINGGLLGTGVLTYKTAMVELSSAKGFVMEWATFAPGASSGWHFHRTAVAVAVTSGTITLYDAKDPKCAAARYSKGQGFFEPPNHVHIAINQGKTPVHLYVTYVGVPGNWRKNPTPLDVAVKSPGNCPASIK